MKKVILISLSLILIGCASPKVQQVSNEFDEEKYHVDLYDCRGGTFFEASAVSLGHAAAGSLWGAFHGAPAGALAGSGWEGAAIGAIAGAVVGFGVGAAEAIKKHEGEIEACLDLKGYTVTG
jgi:outer membrane lipoprotein SlyB